MSHPGRGEGKLTSYSRPLVASTRPFLTAIATACTRFRAPSFLATMRRY
jgi:hypothetical protein